MCIILLLLLVNPPCYRKDGFVVPLRLIYSEGGCARGAASSCAVVDHTVEAFKAAAVL